MWWFPSLEIDAGALRRSPSNDRFGGGSRRQRFLPVTAPHRVVKDPPSYSIAHL